jgi:large subunit ribosomal protein L18
MAKKSKLEARDVRHQRIRRRISGTAERPRLVVFRSSRYIYAQIVDDLGNRTLATASDMPPKKSVSAGGGKLEGKKTDRAKLVGAEIARRCLAKGISKVVFDRAGYEYHGRVSALAAGAREAGLQF